MNYGNMWLGEFEEFVVEELMRRERYASTRAGTIRSLLSERIFPERPFYKGKALDAFIAEHCYTRRYRQLDFVQAHVRKWMSEHADALEEMGISRDAMPRKNMRTYLKLVQG